MDAGECVREKEEKKKKRRAALIKTALRRGAAFCPSPSRRLRRPQAPSARCHGEQRLLLYLHRDLCSHTGERTSLGAHQI